MTESKPGMSFSRRNFIKGAAVLTAAGTLAGCSPQTGELAKTAGDEAPAAVPEEEIYCGVCRGNCFGGCMMDVHVRDGRIVRTKAADFPNPEYNRICTKGLTQVARVYSADRIQYPMKRIGERGEGKFERISWDEAIDTIAEKWQGIIDEYGSSAIAVYTASGNYGMCHGVGFGSAYSRFSAALGLATISGDIDAAQGYADERLFGGWTDGQANNEATDYKNSKVIINWAANPSVSQPQIMHFFMEAKENGTRYIVIDPVYNATASKADWFIPINPTTDGVLAFAILNEIISQGKEDVEFVRAHSEAPLIVKADGSLLRMSDMGVEPTAGEPDPTTGEPTVIDPYAVWDEDAGAFVALEEAKSPAYREIPAVNGETLQTTWQVIADRAAEWPAEKATTVCGVPADDIRELARIFVEDGPVNLYAQLGADHYVNGHYNYWIMYTISVITGNIGKPGAGCGPLCVLPLNCQNFMVSAMPEDKDGNVAPGAGPAYKANKIFDIIDTGKYAGEDATIKSLYVANSNMAAVWADHNRTIEELNAIEFIVVADFAMSETAKNADILLPAAYWLEVNDVFTSCRTHPYFVLQEKAIEPQFESKPDLEIMKLIAEKMGAGSFFDFDEWGYVDMVLDCDAARDMGLTLENLKKNHAVRFMAGEENYISFEGGQFLTPTGRARFYLEDPAPAYDIGQPIDYSKEKTLYWEPTLEAAQTSEARKKYPFHVISEHMRTRTHTQWFNVGYQSEYDPEPLVKINPQDAAELGIVDGDTVRMYNDRGSVVLRATLCSGYPRGIVGSPRSYQNGEFIEGHFASLSSMEYNQVCANQAFNDVAVAIEKA